MSTAHGALPFLDTPRAQTPAQTQINARDCMQIVNESAVQLSRIILSFCYDRISSIMKCAAVLRAHRTAHSFYCFNYIENTCF